MSNRFSSLMLALPVIILWGKYLTNPTNTYPNLTLAIGLLIAAWHIKTLLTLCYHRGAVLDALEAGDKATAARHINGVMGLNPKKDDDNG